MSASNTIAVGPQLTELNTTALVNHLNHVGKTNKVGVTAVMTVASGGFSALLDDGMGACEHKAIAGMELAEDNAVETVGYLDGKTVDGWTVCGAATQSDTKRTVFILKRPLQKQRRSMAKAA